MADGQDPEKVIAALVQAKAKLGEAQQHTFSGLARLNKVRDSVQSALGRLGQGNPTLAALRASEEAIKARAVEINGLSGRIDKAIAQVRHAASAAAAPAKAAALRRGLVEAVMPRRSPETSRSGFRSQRSSSPRDKLASGRRM